MKPSILITGASKGIGLAVARTFYAQDYEVIICARGAEALAAAKAEMPDLHTYSCDLADKSAVLNMMADIEKRFSRLDVLVNNGGRFLPGGIHDSETDVFEQIMDTNLRSAYYVTTAALPAMIAAKKGDIFNVCSVASIKAYAGGGLYGISKFALLGFSQNLREEMKPHGIRVIGILPGAVKTASWDGVDLPEERFIPPEDIASIIWNTHSLSARTVVEDLVVRPFLGDI